MSWRPDPSRFADGKTPMWLKLLMVMGFGSLVLGFVAAPLIACCL